MHRVTVITKGVFDLSTTTNSLDIQDEEHPTIENPLYADAAMEVPYTGLLSQ